MELKNVLIASKRIIYEYFSESTASCAAMVLETWAKGLLDLIFPRTCSGCDRVLHRSEWKVCMVCSDDLPLCRFNSAIDNMMARQLWGRVHFKGALAYAFFEGKGPLRNILHELKYNGDYRCGIWLGRSFARFYPELPVQLGIDVLVPVPLHSRKQRKRGYNQSEMIALGMAEVWGLPVDNQLLLKVKHTSTQTHKSRLLRAENVSAVFQLGTVKASYSCIGLVDDVFTTGATAEACIRLLCSRSQAELVVLTAAFARN